MIVLHCQCLGAREKPDSLDMKLLRLSVRNLLVFAERSKEALITCKEYLPLPSLSLM
jgi:hypothetical protein